jgi:hypothetical protein
MFDGLICRKVAGRGGFSSSLSSSEEEETRIGTEDGTNIEHDLQAKDGTNVDSGSRAKRFSLNLTSLLIIISLE